LPLATAKIFAYKLAAAPVALSVARAFAMLRPDASA
jgi:hypothetical protein